MCAAGYKAKTRANDRDSGGWYIWKYRFRGDLTGKKVLATWQLEEGSTR